jgi:hypothetical protein
MKVTPDPAIAQGAAVLLLNGTPADAGLMFRKGAAIVLTRETAQQRARWYPRPVPLPRRLGGVAERPDRATAIALSNEAADLLQSIADDTPVRLEFTASADGDAGQTFNAVGVLRGSQPSKDAILITSHLDHLGRRETAPAADKIFNGADDDASGTAGVLEIDIADCDIVAGQFLESVLPEDLIKYGLIPEFVGRLPVVATLEELDEPALVRILTEPKNSLIRQYQTIFEFEGVELKFTDEAIVAVAKEALKRNVGARGLRIILEELMLDLMYTVPSQRDIKQCLINEDAVASRTQPITLYKKAG